MSKWAQQSTPYSYLRDLTTMTGIKITLTSLHHVITQEDIVLPE